MAVVHILNKQTSKDSDIMKLVRQFVLLIMKYNVMFKAFHLPGICNTAADQLSRLQINQFKTTFPHMDISPADVNLAMLPL